MASRSLALLAFIVAAFVAVVAAQIASDRITSLPGLQGQLGVQYSGYINVNATRGRFLHYWFVQSQGNPATDPLVLWLNGGPGCSSLDGFLYEHGPYNWAHGHDNTSLVDNPYSWTKLANVIYLEAPAGVGFSYSKTPADYYTSDTQTANDNFIFLTKFFAAYPQFQGRDFYISGESFAGIYVPTLASRVLQGNQNGESNINLKGVLVGNGVTNPIADKLENNLLPFMYGHGLYSMQTQQAIDKYCVQQKNHQQCEAIKNSVMDVFDNIDIYDIYTKCYHQRPNVLSHGPRAHKFVDFSVQMDVPCTNSHKANLWLNDPAVKSAIHVRPDIEWSICNEQINENYNHNMPDMLPIYHQLIQANVRILIFSGDVDASVPFTGTQYWVSQMMNLPSIFVWKPWTVNGQVAGFASKYQGLDFITVKGAGHMVPQFKPIESFYFFGQFLKNQPF